MEVQEDTLYHDGADVWPMLDSVSELQSLMQRLFCSELALGFRGGDLFRWILGALRRSPDYSIMYTMIGRLAMSTILQ